MAKGICDCRRLKGLMVEKGITIQELSNKMGISEKSLSNKINDAHKLLYRELVFITKLFGYKEVRPVFPELYNSVLTKEAVY